MISVKTKVIEEENYDLFDQPVLEGQVDDLPSLTHLYHMFNIYNEQYFGGRLPRVRISWSKRMLAAGGYFPQKREIRLSEKYHRIFPDEVYDTLKHEMIHIIHFHHDAAFKRMAQKIGASVRANEHPALRRSPRYIYICPHCYSEYPRNKRLRMASCGTCSKGKYDERYKLVLKRTVKKAARS